MSNPYNKNLNIFDVQKQKISRTHEEHIFKWRTNVRKLAEYSCIVLKDQRSLGFHISVWAKARKHNLIDEVCQIMTDLEKQSMQTGKPQGALFNKMTRLLFESRGIIETRHADDKERAEAKAALAHFAAEN